MMVQVECASECPPPALCLIINATAVSASCAHSYMHTKYMITQIILKDICSVVFSQFFHEVNRTYYMTYFNNIGFMYERGHRSIYALMLSKAKRIKVVAVTVSGYFENGVSLPSPPLLLLQQFLSWTSLNRQSSSLWS